ncbi:MAG: uracil-DNA glycosylase family protein [Cyclobacteriaceae bacterium]
MKTYSTLILDYYKQLNAPGNLPPEVSVMNPYANSNTFDIAAKFYTKYYNDTEKRYICFGINPGRFGAGVTGVPFTDPVLLETSCGIQNDFEKKAELSSRFIHEMIFAYGGPLAFFSKYYISAVSPLGYLKDGINLNYYDIKGFKPMFEEYVVEQIEKQLQFGIDRQVAYSIGKGQNIKYLNHINNKYGFFDRIIPLSHPRWVMQYRLKRKQEFIEEYVDAFASNEG